MPLDVAETVDGLPLIYCHGGCAPMSILAAGGLDLNDVLPDRQKYHRRKGNGGPAAWGSLMGAVDGAVAAHARLVGIVAPHMPTGEHAAGAIDALLHAAATLERVRAMARRALREGGRP